MAIPTETRASWALPDFKSYLPTCPDLHIVSKLKFCGHVFMKSMSLIKDDADTMAKSFSLVASGMELTGLNSLNRTISSLQGAAAMVDIFQISESVGYFVKKWLSETSKINAVKQAGFALANLNETISWANNVKVIDTNKTSNKILPAFGSAATLGASVGLTASSIQTFVTLKNQCSNFCYNEDDFIGIAKNRFKADVLSILPNMLSFLSTTTELSIIALKYVPTQYIPKDSRLTALSMFAKASGIGAYLFNSDNIVKYLK